MLRVNKILKPLTKINPIFPVCHFYQKHIFRNMNLLCYKNVITYAKEFVYVFVHVLLV